MKRIATIILILIMSLSATACGDYRKKINGVKYDTYELLNQGEKHNPNVKYQARL